MEILTLAILISVSAVAETQDPDIKWFSIPNEKYLYSVSDTELIWLDAFQFCKKFDGDLIDFRDQDEEKNMKDYLKKKFGKSRYFWSSATNSYDLKRWVFMSSGRNASGVTWCFGEPNNWGGNEHCALLQTDKSCWNDAKCTEKSEHQKHYALCKKKQPESIGASEVKKSFPERIMDSVGGAFNRILQAIGLMPKEEEKTNSKPTNVTSAPIRT